MQKFRGDEGGGVIVFLYWPPCVFDPSIRQLTFKNLADNMYERINLRNECDRSIVLKKIWNGFIYRGYTSIKINNVKNVALLTDNGCK